MRASCLAALMVGALCAGCATTRHGITKVRPSRPPDCRVDFLPFAPGAPYEELGRVEVQGDASSRFSAYEKARQQACKAGADAVVTEQQNYTFGHRVSRLVVGFYARPAPPQGPAPAPRRRQARPTGDVAPASPGELANLEPEEFGYYLRHRCESNYDLCPLFARQLEMGDSGMPRDEALAAELYEMLCRHSNALACLNGGVLYSMGRELHRDRLRAALLYEKGCDLKLGAACTNLGVLFSEDLPPGRDEEQMVGLYSEGCNQGDPMGCNNLGWAYERGHVVGTDLKRAAALYERACNAGTLLACQNLAVLSWLGRGMQKDPARATSLFRRACVKGFTASCSAIRALAVESERSMQDLNVAVEEFERSCQEGKSSGCVNLGWIYEIGKGGRPRDLRRALELYEKGCGAGAPVGCSNAASIYESSGGPENTARALALYHKACELGLQAICDSRAGEGHH